MTIYLGSTPCDEDCASVGDEHYRSDAHIEIAAYISQLGRTFHFHRSDAGISFRKKKELHDFGSYYEVIVCPDDLSWFSTSLAYVIEQNIPTTWDVTALQEIILKTATEHFAPQDLAPDGPFAWMKTPVVSLPHGRRILNLVRKVRDERHVSTHEVLASLQPDPLEHSPRPGVLRQFFVVLAVHAERGKTIDFECEVSSDELAIEQAQSTYPGHEVLMHFTRG